MPYLSKSIIDQIWLKATAVDGFNSDKWRKDFAGAWIQRDQFGLSGLQAPFGWSIDHLKPRSMGGSDDVSNLLPLHWKNNVAKSNRYPEFKTVVTSLGNKNIEKERSWTVK